MNAYPKAANEALDLIGVLYKHEEDIKEKELDADEAQQYRAKHSKPVVDYIYAWVRAQRQRGKPAAKDRIYVKRKP